LEGFEESSGFTRDDGQTILEEIRTRAIERLSDRDYDSASDMQAAVSHVNTTVLRHSAQVMVMSTKISALLDADEETSRIAGLAAGYHDSAKEPTNFVYHHLESAMFAEQSMRESSLSNSDEEIRAVTQSIMEHMAFGDGQEASNFMNAALAGEAAGIVKTTEGQDRDERLRYLMGSALLKDEEDIRRVQAWVDANADNYETTGDLAQAMQEEFGGRELSYPLPSSDAAQILSASTVATGEHTTEVIVEGATPETATSLMEAAYSPAEITWAADGLVLSSASSLPKIVDIHQVQWGKAGTEPIVVSMASLAGGAFGQRGTAVDAADALSAQVPSVGETAREEISLMRQFMKEWQQATFYRWARNRPPTEVRKKKKAFEENPFTAFSVQEMLEHQPDLDTFYDVYPSFLEENEDKRGKLWKS
jgi:HD superfamily phosphodiesterase